MKRIAIIAHGLSNGGAERVACILANYFAKEGYEVLFIAAYSPECEYKLESEIKYVYIDVSKHNKYIRLISRSKKIDNEISNFQSDIVISFIINEAIITNLKGKIPIIYSLRIDPADVTRRMINRILCKVSYGRAKQIVFQTKDAKAFFDEKIRKKGVVIGNPLISNLPYWDEDNHDNTVITACRLTTQKNLKMLITAFSRFHKKYPDYSLKIYGKGPLEQSLKDFSKSIGIEQNVQFPGYSKEIHKIMSKSAIFALTSDFEGLSNSMLEALAIGVPTICTDCPPGGAAEYIQDGKNGMLIPVGDIDKLFERLCLMAENKELCKRMSEQSIKIRNVLKEDIILKQWMMLF